MDLTALGQYVATIAAYFIIYNILTWGLNIQFGYAGLPNFTYMTFMAVGAYFTGVLTLGKSTDPQFTTYILGLNLPFPLTLLGGAVAAAALGFGVGIVALHRLRNDYLAIVTFALGFIAYDFVSTYRPVFNGFDGIFGVNPPLNDLLHFDANSYTYFFVGLSGVIMIVLWFIANRIYDSALGRALRAVRDDQEVAESLGKNAFRLKMIAFVIGCFYAGVGGALTIEFVSAINPSGWTAPETFIIWTALLLGGRANNLGAMVGVLVVPVLLSEGTRFLPVPPEHAFQVPALRFIVVGLLMIFVLWFRPGGLLPEKRRFYELPVSGTAGKGAPNVSTC